MQKNERIYKHYQLHITFKIIVVDLYFGVKQAK